MLLDRKLRVLWTVLFVPASACLLCSCAPIRVTLPPPVFDGLLRVTGKDHFLERVRREHFHTFVATGNLPLLKAEVETLSGNPYYSLFNTAANGDTVLATACHGIPDAPEIAEYLLEKGIDPFAKNQLGQTAYDLAVANGHPKMAGVILEHMRKRARRNTAKDEHVGKPDDARPAAGSR